MEQEKINTRILPFNIIRVVKEEIEFLPEGTFGSIGKAEQWLTENGYTYGSMQREAPIAIGLKSEEFIWPKWRNIAELGFKEMSGIIETINSDFREGGAKIVLFKEYKEQNV